MSALIVAKFGGSSVQDASRMRQAVRVALDRGAHLVVTSATKGSTDALLKLCSLDSEWIEAQGQIGRLEDRHLSIAAELNARQSSLDKIKEFFVNLSALVHGISLLGECSPKLRDRILCLGELISSTLLVEAFRAEGAEAAFFDVRQVLITDERYGRAQPVLSEIKQRCHERLSTRLEKGIVVTQGFIAATENGSTTTLGRGGSDYSAALLAEALNAKRLEIWTDVPGMASTDPRVCPEARPIKELSFKEASELATFGAKVLHPTTVWPSIRKGFPIFIGDTLQPEVGGTWIRSEVEDSPLVRAISVKKSQCFLTISTPEMSQAYGFLARVFDVFRAHELSIDTVTTSEISVGVTIDEEELSNEKLLRDLKFFGSLEIERSLALISVVGNNIRHTPGLLEKLLRSIDGVNLRSICGGASKHQLCFLVSENEAPDCVQKIHGSFIQP